MIKNRIPITLNDERQRVTGPTVSYRYDAVQYLIISGIKLPEAYAVDFCNLGDETTTPIVGGADGVRIPNKYLRTGKTIIAYLIITGDDEDAVETRYEITLPVRSRPKRGELDPTEDEREEIDILVDRLNEAVAEAEEQATAAGESAASAEENAGKAETAVTHYPKIVDRYWYVWDTEHETWTNTGIKAEGVDGTDGVGIQSLVWNSDYTMTITMTNGTVYTSISLRGEVGATPNFRIGTVTTGAAGSQASATITGTPERPVLNLTIPRGDTGEVSQDDLAEALRPLNQAINLLDTRLKSGLEADAELHLGFYLDENGDLCQVEEENNG